jgi:hypothetical protein
MVDHLASAKGYRNRAARCELAAKNTSSAEFSDCYRLLATHYVALAKMEEDYAGWQTPFPNSVIPAIPAD